MEGFRMDKTLLTSREMQSILAGLRSLDSVSGTSRYKQLMDKLAVGNQDLINVDSHIVINLSSWYKESLTPKIKLIQDAIEDSCLIHFSYYSPSGETGRTIEPYTLVFQWASWYVWGLSLIHIWWEIGFRCLANNARPINSVEDVKGLRLRVMSNEVHQALWTALGADPVPMSLSDAYVANQNGTIDGQDNPLHSLIANSTFEVCHYIAVTNHVYSPLGVIVSPKAWASMSPEDQELFMECMKEATANQKKLVREQNEKAAKELEEKGCEVTYPQLQPFADKMEVVYEQYPQFSVWLDKIK